MMGRMVRFLNLVAVLGLIFGTLGAERAMASALALVDWGQVEMFPTSISAYEYRYRMRKHHIPKVASGFMMLLDSEFKSYFPDLTKEFVLRYVFATHDIPKYMPLSELKKYGYAHHDDIATVFGLYYGVDRRDMSDRDKEIFNVAYNEMNRIEKLIKLKYLDDYFRPKAAADYEKIERIFKQLELGEAVADVVDTSLSDLRRIELNITEAKLWKAVQFFLNSRNASMPQVAMAHYLVNELTSTKSRCQGLLTKASESARDALSIFELIHEAATLPAPSR